MGHSVGALKASCSVVT